MAVSPGQSPFTKSSLTHSKYGPMPRGWEQSLAFSSGEGAFSPIRITTVLAHEEDTVGLLPYLEAVVTPPNSKDP